jgi:nucleotide-binding universal stress UspA family protein
LGTSAAREGTTLSGNSTESASPFSRILVAIDGSDASMRAATMAARLASVHRVPVLVVYVVDDAALEQMAPAARSTADGIAQQLQMKGRRYLEYVSSIAERYGVRCTTILRRGIPHVQITEVARDRGIDLVVLGLSPTESGPTQGGRRALAGSTADLVIAQVLSSVLVVK